MNLEFVIFPTSSHCDPGSRSESQQLPVGVERGVQGQVQRTDLTLDESFRRECVCVLCLCFWVFLNISVCASASMCVYLGVCVCMHACAHIHECVWVLFVCVSLFLCVYIWLCVWVCASVSVWVYLGIWFCPKGPMGKCLWPRLCSLCSNAVRPLRLVYLTFQGTELRKATSAES